MTEDNWIDISIGPDNPEYHRVLYENPQFKNSLNEWLTTACGKKFSSRHLTVHMNTSSMKDEYICNECGIKNITEL